ncbi:MAG: pectinesterase family protein [Clostridia bacterium]|nr:pectinesterase family protein [Clostridia bacterium]
MKKVSYKCQKSIAWIMTLLMVVTLIPISMFVKTTEVLAGESDVVFEDGLATTEAKANTAYVYDFTQCSDIANNYSKGLFSFNAGSYNGAAYNGATYGVEFKSGNILTFPVMGNSTIVVGGDNNNKCTDLAATSSTGSFEPSTLSMVTAGHATLDDCKTKGDNTLVYEYTGSEGKVTLTLDPSYTKADGQASTKAYIAYVCVIPNGDQTSSVSDSGEESGEVTKTREVKYDFTNNTDKNKPAVDSILDGTNTDSDGILYAALGSGSGCTFDSNVLRFRNTVTLYLPIKDDTTKITYTYLGAGNNAGRQTYFGSKDSGYTIDYSSKEASITIDDITDYIVTKNGQNYFPIISGGDIKIKYITLTEYNPINSVNVSGKVENAAANGVTEITFKNLDNDKAEAVKATIDASGVYDTTLRRVAGKTNYVASISKSGCKIDDTSGANKFTLTGNDATSIQNFTVISAPIAKISGTFTGVPDNAIFGGELSVKLAPQDTAYSSIEVAISKVIDGEYAFSDVEIDPSQTYDVVISNADDYEVKDSLSKSAGTYTGVVLQAEKKPVYRVSGKFVTSDKKSASVSTITFTNMDKNDYKYSVDVSGDAYSIELRDGEYETTVECNGYTAFDHVSVNGSATKNDVYLQGAEDTSATTYKSEINVGKGEEFETITEAIDYISRMTRSDDERVTINLKDSLYREQVLIDTPNVTINGNEATVTWYYGTGFSYYSAHKTGDKAVYYDEAYAVDKYAKQDIQQNAGHWGATVNLLSGAKGFKAENLTFENSLNRYITEEELADGAGVNSAAGVTDRRTENIDVRTKASKERGCVIYIQADDTEYKDCKFLSSQDTIFTGDNSENSYFKNCVIEGTTDYICGDGNPVFDECELSMYSYSDQQAKESFIVASKSVGVHGYLFNNCKIVTTKDSGLQPTSGNYLARAWAAGRVVFYNTEVESAGMICEAAYKDMNAKVADAKYFEYNTHTPDGTVVDMSKRAKGVTIMDDAAAATINVKDYFDGWNPEYYERTAVAHNIKVTAASNGSASADVEEATEGTVVKIKATANDGYKFSKWNVVSGNIELADSTAESTTFVMTNEEVVIKAEFVEKETTTEPTTGSQPTTGGQPSTEAPTTSDNVKVVPDESGEVPVKGVEVSSDVKFTDKNGKEIASGTVSIKADAIADTDKSELQNKINSLISSDDVKGMKFVDINALVNNIKVTVSNGTITITVKLDDSIDYNSGSDIVRVFHKTDAGIVEHAVTKGDDRNISFKVNSLSPFAIVVSKGAEGSNDDSDDGEKETTTQIVAINPTQPATQPSQAEQATEASSEASSDQNVTSAKTGDTAPIALLAIIAGVCACAIAFSTKKRAR